MDKKVKTATAHVLLSRAVLLNAPNYVINALSDWIRAMEKESPSARSFSEDVGVGEEASLELRRLRSKTDA